MDNSPPPPSSPLINQNQIPRYSTKMMKLTILLFALFFIAHTCCASKWHQQESCSYQLQQINLEKCEKHIMERIQDDDDDDVLATVRGRISYHRKNEKEEEEEEEHLQKYCCTEIRELDSPKCQCRALQKMMERQSEKLEDKEKMEMEKELMRVAMKCGFGPMMMIGCDLSSQD